MDSSTKPGPQGIGGWLIIPMIGMTISLFLIARSTVIGQIKLFHNGAWERLTSPSSDNYHSLWALTLIFELVGNVIMVALAVASLLLILKESRLAPKAAIAWYASGPIFAITDYLLSSKIPAVATIQAEQGASQEIIRTCVAAAIWIPYFLVSKRVRATFIR